MSLLFDTEPPECSPADRQVEPSAATAAMPVSPAAAVAPSPHLDPHPTPTTFAHVVRLLDRRGVDMVASLEHPSTAPMKLADAQAAVAAADAPPSTYTVGQDSTVYRIDSTGTPIAAWNEPLPST